MSHDDKSSRRVKLQPSLRKFVREYMILYASWVLTEPRINASQMRAAKKLYRQAVRFV